MSRLALIRPPAVCSRFATSVGVVPPIGPAYLAAALRTSGHRVDVIDALGEAPTERAGPAGHPELVYYGLGIPEILDRIDPSVEAFGVSVMFSQQWPFADRLVRALRERFSGRPIFVGGEHATGSWKHILRTCAPVTACVLGEGEETIVELAEHVDGRGELADIPGIAFRDGGAPRRTGPRNRIRAIDSIPRPAWDLFPLDSYFASEFGYGVHRGRSMPILATRGCPYQCTFCSSPSMWTTRYVTRDVLDVADEIESYVARYGVENVDFVDLTMILKRDWILSFCGELERRNLSITYQLPSGTRSEALDGEVLEKLYKTGCRNLCYAPESGSERVLDLIKKRVRPERLLASVRAASELGISVKANLVIGFPDETRSDLWQTVKLGLRLAWSGADTVPLFPFIAYPGTELYDSLRASGAIPEPNDDYFARLGYLDPTSTQSLSRHVGAAELAFVRLAGMSAFFATAYARRPHRLFRTLRNLAFGRAETVLEQRLIESTRRWLAAKRDVIAPPRRSSEVGRR